MNLRPLVLSASALQNELFQPYVGGLYILLVSLFVFPFCFKVIHMYKNITSTTSVSTKDEKKCTLKTLFFLRLELTEENLLHLQLGYFEEMRKHMEEQQRQQLQQLLIEQQQAQMTLQLEMAELEKQFRQKQGLMAGNKDDGKGLSKEVLRETVDRGEKDVSECEY